MSLYYFGARYYEPEVGRFLTPDPMADKYASWSPYNYALDNPLRFTDPTGRQVEGEEEEEKRLKLELAGKIRTNLEQVLEDISSKLVEAVEVFTDVLSLVPGVGPVAVATAEQMAKEATGQKVEVGELAKGYGEGALDLIVGAGFAKKVGKASKIEKHHNLVRQFKKFFERAELDIEDFTEPLTAAKHRLKPHGLHTKEINWNKLWKKFIESTPEATKEEILEQLEKMKKATRK